MKFQPSKFYQRVKISMLIANGIHILTFLIVDSDKYCILSFLSYQPVNFFAAAFLHALGL